MTNEVILVDVHDNEIGVMEKMRAHQDGLLHRAFSIFIFNGKSELLLHRRALTKYHSGGLWTNTCCSHPPPNMDLNDSAVRRLQQEMGMACSVEKKFDFIYRAQVGELTEYEFDHVFFGYSDNNPNPDPEEVCDWKWMSISDIDKALLQSPNEFTAWFHIAWPMVMHQISKA